MPKRFTNDFIGNFIPFTEKKYKSFIFFILSFSSLYSQNAKIELGQDQVAINQYWEITLTIENEKLKSYTPFPEIEGFIKRQTSSSSSTTFINGQMSYSQSITQNYQPKQEGNFKIPPFTMVVNGKEIRTSGKQVKVTAPVQQQRRPDPFDPFQDIFGGKSKPQEFVDVKADAFFALSTDKASVYVGEGFVTTLALYVSEVNRADLRFYDLSTQLTEILKELKPENCWEENFNIDNISGEPIEINGKRFSQYKIYQAAYYPLNTNEINFPSFPLKLIKYKVAKNPTFFGRNRQEDFETFTSKPKKVQVKPLPDHPLRESVAVGNYRLQENISSEQLTTGQSFSYNFSLVGEGNLNAISNPQFDGEGVFEFYEPNVRQNMKRASNSVRGSKIFDYYVIPNEPGQYDLGQVVKWVYFNTSKEKYDTLRSVYQVSVTGASRKNEAIKAVDMGSFYDHIPFEDNILVSRNSINWFQVLVNILIFAALGWSSYRIFKR